MKSQLIARLEIVHSLLRISLLSRRTSHKSLLDEARIAAPPPLPRAREAPIKAAPEVAPAPIIAEQKEVLPLPITYNFVPFLQTLSERPKKREERLVEKYRETFEKHSVCLDTNPRTPIKRRAWQEAVPLVIIITAFTKGSPKELFMQKVATALQERLGKTVLYTTCSQTTAGAVVAYASTQATEAVLVAYDVQTKKDVQSFLGCLPIHACTTSEKTGSCGLFESSYQVFSTPIYELLIPQDGEQTAAFKALLWKSLQNL